MSPIIVHHDVVTPTAATRLQQLAGILQAVGVPDLSQVESLDFTANETGALLPTAGITVVGATALGHVRSVLEASGLVRA